MASFIVLLIMGVIYFGLCGLVSMAGSNRQLSAGWAFLISILLSPFVGIICVALSERKTTIQFRSNLVKEMNEQRELLTQIKNALNKK